MLSGGRSSPRGGAWQIFLFFFRGFQLSAKLRRQRLCTFFRRGSFDWPAVRISSFQFFWFGMERSQALLHLRSATAISSFAQRPNPVAAASSQKTNRHKCANESLPWIATTAGQSPTRGVRRPCRLRLGRGHCLRKQRASRGLRERRVRKRESATVHFRSRCRREIQDISDPDRISKLPHPNQVRSRVAMGVSRKPSVQFPCEQAGT
jgi:hypothetical protein